MSFCHSILSRWLRALAAAVNRHPTWFIYSQLLLSSLCFLYAITHLQLDMNRDNLVDPKARFFQTYMSYRREFPQDDLVVLVESENPERNRQFIERFAARVKPQTNVFQGIFYKGDLPTLGPKALLLSPADDLEKMRQAIAEYRPFLQEFSQATNLVSLFELVNRQFLSAATQNQTQTRGNPEALLSALPFFNRVLVEANDSLKRPGEPVPPGMESLFGGDSFEEYLNFAQNRIFLLTVEPKTAAMIPRAIERLRQALRETEREVQGVNAGVTGEPVLDYDEMRQSERDTIVASVAALIICSLIFAVAYREATRPLKAALCLLIGIGYALGFTTLVVGHLNVLSITFAPMLIGLGLDFGVQFISRYEEEMRNQSTPADAVHQAMVFTGQGIVICAVTVAAAFLAMALTDFKGVRELGVICGGGLLLCLVPMMTMLPALLLRGRHGNLRDYRIGPAGQARLHFERRWLRRPLRIIVTVLVLTALAATQLHRVHFDYDLLRLQSRNLASVNYENKLIHSAGRSVIFAAVMADSPQEAAQLEQKIKALPAVANVDSVGQYLIGNQQRKLASVRAIRNDLAGVQFAPIDRQPVQIDDLSATLWALGGYLGLGANAVQSANPELARQLGEFRENIQEFRRTLLSGEPQIPGQLEKFQQAFFQELHGTIRALQTQDASAPLQARDLPPVLRDRFIGTTGKYLLQVYPKKDVWQRDNQVEFIRQLETVVPPDRVTGTPVQLLHNTDILKQSYQQAALYALVAIAIMLLLYYGSVGWTLFALLPVVIGSTWLLGLMGGLSIPLNPANIMILPLLVGIGVTNGIQILNRVVEEHSPSVLSKSTGKAVLVSGLTALTGFGTLLLAKHQGIRSLGEIIPLGIASCMIVGLTFLPALLAWLEQRKLRRREPDYGYDYEAGWRRFST